MDIKNFLGNSSKNCKTKLNASKEEASNRQFYSKSKKLIATGCNGLVRVNSELFVEFTQKQLNLNLFKQKWPKSKNLNRFYDFFVGPDDIKCCKQLRHFKECRPGFYYIALSSLYVRK